MKNRRHPLREPMVWLVIALPLAAVISSIWLVMLSMRGGSIDSVADEVHRTGQIQTTDLGPDARAAQLKLSAVLQSEAGMLRVFPASGEFRRGEPLQLKLLHPHEQEGDEVLTLQPDELGWQVKYAADPRHDWNLQLSDGPIGADLTTGSSKTGDAKSDDAHPNGSWRLRGRLPQGQHAAHLGPALDAQ
ncbi:FixH family protein [Thermomonas sp.]